MRIIRVIISDTYEYVDLSGGDDEMTKMIKVIMVVMRIMIMKVMQMDEWMDRRIT